jgi:hypothetical protein
MKALVPGSASLVEKDVQESISTIPGGDRAEPAVLPGATSTGFRGVPDNRTERCGREVAVSRGVVRGIDPARSVARQCASRCRDSNHNFDWFDDDGIVLGRCIDNLRKSAQNEPIINRRK